MSHLCRPSSASVITGHTRKTIQSTARYRDLINRALISPSFLQISESLGIRIKDILEEKFGLKGWFDLVADLFRLNLVIERCLCRMIWKPLMKRILNKQSLRLVAFWCSCTMRRNRVNGVRQAQILNQTRRAYPYFYFLLLWQTEWQCAKENNIPIIVVVGCVLFIGQMFICSGIDRHRQIPF